MVKTASFNPVSLLLDVARDNHRPAEAALSGFLDYAIEAFAAEKYTTHDSIESILSEAKEKSEPYLRLLLYWFIHVERQMQHGRWYDFFGSVYEQMFQSKSKASQMGQFFTPPSVSNLMADIELPIKREKTRHSEFLTPAAAQDDYCFLTTCRTPRLSIAVSPSATTSPKTSTPSRARCAPSTSWHTE